MAGRFQSRSLFDDPLAWKTDPVAAFDAFLVSRRFVEMGRRPRKRDAEGNLVPAPAIRPRSAMVYRAMFGKFVRWLDVKRLGIFEVRAQHIETFLNDRSRERRSAGKTRDLNSAIRLRYLRMLERVYGHLRVTPNPAQAAAYAMHAAREGGRDQSKVSLTLSEQRAFLRALPAATEPQEGESPKAWKRRRDRAMLAILLGAGLKVSEVIGLYVDNVVDDGAEDGSLAVNVPAAAVHGTGRDHTTRLRAFAVPELRCWLAERAGMRHAGRLLFPATLKEKRHGNRLNPSTVYLLVKETFAAAGIDVARKGPRTLRNAFAKTELAHGTAPEDLIEYMGFYETRSLEKYLPVRGAARNRPRP